MILILSESNDKITDAVIDWLLIGKSQFVRVNETDYISNVLITEEDVIIVYENGLQININEISTFWHRRGDLKFKPIVGLNRTDLPIQVKQHLHDEWSDIKKFIFFHLHQKQGIFNKTLTVNKLIVLQFAKDLGLSIPHWVISCKNSNLPKFNVVTKAISDSLDLYIGDKYYTFYTEKFQQKQQNSGNRSFFPTFFQEQINKFIDIRTIFIKGNIWSMAIYETSNIEQIVDFRKNYGNHKYLPITLPDNIDLKLKKLMKKMHLDYAAIDLILDNNDKYYFLEVNPYGQFEMVSGPCNYYIEKNIAKMLLQYENETY